LTERNANSPPASRIFNHLIQGEAGTSKFLATLLDPQLLPGPHAIQEQVWSKLQQFLAAEGIHTKSGQPQGIAVSHDVIRTDDGLQREIDLSVFWDSWWILIENKVKRTSIRPRQIQTEYDLAREALRRGMCLEEPCR
jgi:hypothetical protein